VGIALKVLLVDVDSIWGSLPHMKLSTYHKGLGDEVFLNRINPKQYWTKRNSGPESLLIDCPMQRFDKVYVSCIFSKNRRRALSAASMFRSMGMAVEVGGSGISLSKTLPEEVEHLIPDYDLYGLDYSMGFITRGCIRKCPWCVVPKKEGNIRFNAPLKEFVHPRHRKIMLLDNNLLAYEGHYELLLNLIGYQVCFNQGLDLRLIDGDNAKLLGVIDHRCDEFKNPRLYMAWDLPELESQVLGGLATLNDHGVPYSHDLVFILCGWNITKDDYTWDYFLDHDWHRNETLRKLGTKPYVMKYNQRLDIPLLNAFQRWNNWMFKAKRKELGFLESFKTFLEHNYARLYRVLKDEMGR